MLSNDRRPPTADRRFFDDGRRAYQRLRTFFLSALLFLSTAFTGCGGEGHDHADAPVVATANSQQYTCSMHPQIIEDEPGYCPICNMALVPIKDTASSEGVVQIDPVTLQNIGVRTATVQVEALERELRTTGRFEANERATTAVTLKVGGYVEQLYVNYEGARVRRGQQLLDLYSPELVSTQEEYLLAHRNAQRMQQSGLASAAADAERLLAAARRRLAFWDISEDQIKQLEASGTPQRTLTIYAPASGTVMMKSVVEGQQVMPGQTLMQLVDLSSIWLMVDVYEQDLSWVKVGTPASIELPYAPGQAIAGKVDYLYDTLDPATRTVKARVSLRNPGLQIKPGMYATVRLVGGALEAGPVVPEEAVIRTGERDVVLLALGDGRFAPQQVVLGPGGTGKYRVLEGLQGGEQIVTSAQFLIDSEARLRSAVSSLDTYTRPATDQAPTFQADIKTMLVDVHAADTNRDGTVYQCEAIPHLIQDGSGTIPGCTGAARHTSVGEAQVALHRAGYTNVPVNPALADKNGDGMVFQSPMHHAALQDTPGNCPVCNMTLMQVTVEEARANLVREGYTVR